MQAALLVVGIGVWITCLALMATVSVALYFYKRDLKLELERQQKNFEVASKISDHVTSLLSAMETSAKVIAQSRLSIVQNSGQIAGAAKRLENSLDRYINLVAQSDRNDPMTEIRRNAYREQFIQEGQSNEDAERSAMDAIAYENMREYGREIE